MQDLSQFSLEGKIALVTGASSGIGYALARGLAKAGAHIIAAARRTDKLQALTETINNEGGKAIAITLDVTKQDSITQAFDEAEAKLNHCPDILVNNAGVGFAQNFLRMEKHELDFVMDTNFNGVFYVAKEAANRMAEKGAGGSIINIASVLGINGKRGYTAYCASKAAVVNLTRAMALDLTDKNIRVNAIAPGWFKTEINEDYLNSEHGKAFLKATPYGDAGKLEDLVGPVIMLASDAGAFVNGITIPVDGAHTATWI